MKKNTLTRLINEAKKQGSKFVKMPDGYGVAVSRIEELRAKLLPGQELLNHGAGNWLPDSGFKTEERKNG